MGGVGGVICEGHEAGVVHVACISREDEVMVPVIGIAGIISWEGMRRASVGVAAAVGEVRWKGACSRSPLNLFPS
jgi:hypothetical protein